MGQKVLRAVPSIQVVILGRVMQDYNEDPAHFEGVYVDSMIQSTSLIFHILKGMFWSINRNKSNNTSSMCILKRKTDKKALR